MSCLGWGAIGSKPCSCRGGGEGLKVTARKPEDEFDDTGWFGVCHAMLRGLKAARSKNTEFPPLPARDAMQPHSFLTLACCEKLTFVRRLFGAGIAQSLPRRIPRMARSKRPSLWNRRNGVKFCGFGHWLQCNQRYNQPGLLLDNRSK